jgi:diadenosine tetraphosphate (Ap4A) HIT family hydrolase
MEEKVVIKKKSLKERRKEEIDELFQYKLTDLIQLKARSGAEYWYADIWKTVNKCVFCDLRNRYIIKEYNGLYLTVNIYPYIDGSLMIVPKRHITHIKDMTTLEWEAVRVLEYVAKKMLKAIFGYDSLWLIYREGTIGEKSQKTVEHMHIHLLPYQDGLVTWNYKKIKIPPFETAAIFRDNKKVIDDLVLRYQEKSKVKDRIHRRKEKVKDITADASSKSEIKKSKKVISKKSKV